MPPARAKQKPPLAHCTGGRGLPDGVRRGCLIRAAPTRKWIIARNRALAPYCPRIGLRFASGAARRAALLRRYRAVRLSADRVLPIALKQRSGRVAKENAEQWPSGRRRTPGKCVYGNPVSRVRIPPAPPFFGTRTRDTLRGEPPIRAVWLSGLSFHHHALVRRLSRTTKAAKLSFQMRFCMWPPNCRSILV